jgi:hypothetical protein
VSKRMTVITCAARHLQQQGRTYFFLSENITGSRVQNRRAVPKTHLP